MSVCRLKTLYVLFGLPANDKSKTQWERDAVRIEKLAEYNGWCES